MTRNLPVGHAAERTPWFKWPVRPAREGWYEMSGFLVDDGERYYWNGSQWGFWANTDWIHLADVATDQWRGLTESGLRSFIETVFSTKEK